MKALSELVREGSKLRSASHSGWCDNGPDGQPRTCALLAAYEAAGMLMFESGLLAYGPNAVLGHGDYDARTGKKCTHSIKIPDEWVKTLDTIVELPCACEDGVLRHANGIVWHLHDYHHWSREAVAEWLETIEKMNEMKARDTYTDKVVKGEVVDTKA